MRKIHIQGKVWQYQIGSGVVSIKFPPPNQGRGFTVDLSQLVERTQEDIDRGRRKKTEAGMIRPADVKRYIEKNLSEIVAKQDARKKK